MHDSTLAAVIASWWRRLGLGTDRPAPRPALAAVPRAPHQPVVVSSSGAPLRGADEDVLQALARAADAARRVC